MPSEGDHNDTPMVIGVMTRDYGPIVLRIETDEDVDSATRHSLAVLTHLVEGAGSSSHICRCAVCRRRCRPQRGKGGNPRDLHWLWGGSDPERLYVLHARCVGEWIERAKPPALFPLGRIGFLFEADCEIVWAVEKEDGEADGGDDLVTGFAQDVTPGWAWEGQRMTWKAAR